MSVLCCAELGREPLQALLARYGLRIDWLPLASVIPGSYWGETEAGLISDRLLLRDDTPVHSALHEACHYICMDAERRARLHTDAGGEPIEENGVCYLQILLADALPGFGRVRMWADMDTWGYSFRLGSARAWFEQDADDARQWLLDNGLIDAAEQPVYRLRQGSEQAA
ncbi:MAG: hypothetical protein EKK69_09900 [Candidatus Competibacteraceae bacterium]|nr:MAG: hypothetical protein EKK69_09900 [Candidatus Competibacteraceae bacterium]